MIEFTNSPHWRNCYCCGKQAVKEIAFRRDGQGDLVAVCGDCLKELAHKTIAAIAPGHGDLLDRDDCENFSYKSRAGTPDDIFDAGVLLALDHLDEVPVIIPADRSAASPMSDMLTVERGIHKDGAPYIVFTRQDGPFVDVLQEALRKLHRYETAQAQGRLIFAGEIPEVKELEK